MAETRVYNGEITQMVAQMAIKGMKIGAAMILKADRVTVVTTPMIPTRVTPSMADSFPGLLIFREELTSVLANIVGENTGAIFCDSYYHVRK
jgi:hypothetical protein